MFSRGTAALLVVALLAGGATRATAQAAAGPAPRGDAAAESYRAAVARARADSARLPYTAADVRFMTAMIGHHAQAVAMSRLAPERAASPAVRTLAARIINAQQDEIAIMRQWLRERRQPVPESGDGMAHHETHDGAHHDAAGHDTTRQMPHDSAAHAGMAHREPGHAAGHEASPMMPGMLTAAQLRQLEAARGEEFDRFFLSFMIQHHQGAVAMVKALFGTPGAGQDEAVFRFATDVNVDQTTEIARMQRMLADVLFGAP